MTLPTHSFGHSTFTTIAPGCAAFAYALGLVLTTHRGVVDLSSPAPIECERGEVECDEKMLPERVEVFVREER